jgi:probable HAF family extracellular repeat protein
MIAPVRRTEMETVREYPAAYPEDLMRAPRHVPLLGLGSALLAVLLAGCAGEATSPGESALRPSAAASGAGPAVKSAVPDSAPRNTRLTVRVLGSGFDPGSRAVWALNGDTAFATTKILTNTTTYVSSTELQADITIAADAPLDRYDLVVVTTRGKKGIGIELFTVTYERVDLGTLGGASSVAQSINDAGQIAGVSQTIAGDFHVFVWANGIMQDLGPGQVSAINALGAVTGYITNRAVVWSPKSGGGYNPPTVLGTLGGTSSAGRSINDQGQVTGESTIPSGASHAFLSTGGVLTDIHTVTGGNTFPWGMNNLGHVVGQWNTATTQSFLWTPATGMRILPTLGGAGGVALDVNDNGQVVGWSEPAPGQQYEAYIYENGITRRLGTLGAPGSVATAINRFGQAAGRASVGSRRRTVQHAVYWTAAGGIQDLGLPKGSTFGAAWDINALGSIVGEVQLSSGAERATLWRLH